MITSTGAPSRTRRFAVRSLAIALGTAILFAGCSSGSGERADDAASAPAVVSPTDFGVLHPAVGFGLLRVMTLEERPNPRDVVIYAALPNELPRVAGVITTVAQTPLSHVNLRAVQDDIPNAVVPGALDDAGIAALVGRYVKYTVRVDGVDLAPATQAEVEAFHAASRPSEPQVPARDLSVTKIAELSDVRFADWTAYGVKAANVATLATFDLPNVDIPDGYAVPFAFYDEFMTANGFYDRVAKLLADPTFRDDPDVQDRELGELRDDIKDASMSPTATAALAAIQRSFPTGTSIRCRSSTNNEDLPGFSGAGLYDSKTQHPDEGPLTKCVKQVYASVWNLRAFLERDFYRIDHLTTAMAVLLHPSFSDETANGVAVTVDPVFDSPGAFYVNAQLGEDLVTNPEAKSVPEALLLAADGTVAYITRSNLIEPGTQLLTDAQVATLRAALTTIDERFRALYSPPVGERFAIEIEFKITATGGLSIKQARPWVFS